MNKRIFSALFKTLLTYTVVLVFASIVIDMSFVILDLTGHEDSAKRLKKELHHDLPSLF